jgi:hypothetical protein
MAGTSYFALFSTHGFAADPTSTFEDEFRRLSKHMGWGGKAQARNRNKALQGEIKVIYGDATKLQGWQSLCVDVGISPPPQSITKCKAVGIFIAMHVV